MKVGVGAIAGRAAATFVGSSFISRRCFIGSAIQLLLTFSHGHLVLANKSIATIFRPLIEEEPRLVVVLFGVGSFAGKTPLPIRISASCRNKVGDGSLWEPMGKI